MSLLSDPRTRTVATLATLIVLALLVRSGTLAGTYVEKTVKDSQKNTPSEAQKDLQVQNYYEALVAVERDPEWDFGGPVREWVKTKLGRGGAKEPDGNWKPLQAYGGQTELPLEQFLEHTLTPNWSNVHKGVQNDFNQWGHRDDANYGKEKPDGVFRIALCGSSNSMGSGVERATMYEPLVEHLLNAEFAGKGPYQRYEIINMSVVNYHMLERVYVAEEIAPEFHPDLILVEITMRDLRRALYNGLIHRVQQGRELHFDFVRDIVTRAGAKKGQSENNLAQRFGRFRKQLATGALHDLAEFSRRSGIPVALCVFRLEVDGVDPNLTEIAASAEIEGLITLQIWDAYEGHTPEEMYLIPERDYHPTPLGHRLLADELFADLKGDPTIHALLTGESAGDLAPAAPGN